MWNLKQVIHLRMRIICPVSIDPFLTVFLRSYYPQSSRRKLIVVSWHELMQGKARFHLRTNSNRSVPSDPCSQNRESSQRPLANTGSCLFQQEYFQKGRCQFGWAPHQRISADQGTTPTLRGTSTTHSFGSGCLEGRLYHSWANPPL